METIRLRQLPVTARYNFELPCHVICSTSPCNLYVSFTTVTSSFDSLRHRVDDFYPAKSTVIVTVMKENCRSARAS